MKWRLWSVLALIVLAGIVGCFPEKRVLWSPDGRWAAVVGGDGLYVCGEDGQLSPRVAESVKRVAWLPDSRHLLMARVVKIKTWPEMLPFVSDERRQRLEDAAEQTRGQVLAYEGDFDEFEPQGLDDLTDGEKGAMFLCLRDGHAEGLPEKLGEKWDDLKDAAIDGWSLQWAEWAERGARPGRVLVRSADEMLELCVSADGGAVAFVAPAPGGSGAGRLLVVPSDGTTPPRLVAEYVARGVDWSAEGQYLTYANTKGPYEKGALTLGEIARRAVRDEAGQLLEEFGKPEDLAGVVFQPELRVRCLKTGEILFAAMEVHLPCTAGDMPQRMSLFALEPEKHPVVVRVMPRGAEDEVADGVFLFEVSPDEKHVCIPGMSGEVSILTLATGKVWTLIDKEHAAGKLHTVPTWRSDDELCAAVPGAAGSERAEVARLRLDWSKPGSTTTVISRDWSDDVARDFLLPEKRGTQQTGD